MRDTPLTWWVGDAPQDGGQHLDGDQAGGDGQLGPRGDETRSGRGHGSHPEYPVNRIHVFEMILVLLASATHAVAL